MLNFAMQKVLFNVKYPDPIIIYPVLAVIYKAPTKMLVFTTKTNRDSCMMI